MYFCSPEKCALCFLVVGSASCLRKQAARCMQFSKTVTRRGVREALEDLGLILIDEASSLESELAIPPAS